MRSIGEFDDEDHATNFCGYLNGINIRTEVEDEGDGRSVDGVGPR